MSTISFFGTLVDTIKAHYELPEILNVVRLPSLRSHAGDPDSVYQITIESKSYVLRPFRTEVIGAIELHNQFLHWTERSGFPLTQRIIQTRAGEDFFKSEIRFCIENLYLYLQINYWIIWQFLNSGQARLNIMLN